MIAVWAVALRRLSYGEITIALWAMPFPLLMGCAGDFLSQDTPFNLEVRNAGIGDGRLCRIPILFG